MATSCAPPRGVSPLLPLTTEWSVLVPVRDRRRSIARSSSASRSTRSWPARLIARAILRSKNLAVNMAIVHQARVDVRLHMLLWHLAARWGRVRSDGTVLRLRLTHAVLADLVAARRPTVTTALSELAGAGSSRIDGETWMLSGEAPNELLAYAREANRAGQHGRAGPHLALAHRSIHRPRERHHRACSSA